MDQEQEQEQMHVFWFGIQAATAVLTVCILFLKCWGRMLEVFDCRREKNREKNDNKVATVSL